MTDVALWAAVRALREKEGLLRRLAEVEGAHDREAAAGCLAEADDLARTVDAFRRVMSAAPVALGID
jgi:two-component system chemotaxis response regulator CheB